MDLPDATDLALHWVPGICVWGLVQALAIDLLGASMGALAAGLTITRAGSRFRGRSAADATATRARLFARELLRAAPAACAMVVAAVLVELDAHTASFWALGAGLALAVATAAWNGVAALRGARSMLDIVSGTRVERGAHRAVPPVASAPTPGLSREAR
jgi:enolase